MPSSSEGRATSGRLLRQASICASTVVISSKVSLTLLATLRRCDLKLFTVASQMAPKCGARSGINFHCIFCVEQNAEICP